MSTELTLADSITYSQAMAASTLLPESYRKQPANILVAMEAAKSLGITPFQAIQGISVIKGKMTMSAELMRALVLRAGHMLRVDTLTDKDCTLSAARREYPDEVQVFDFTWDDAVAAGLAGSDTYRKHPKAMLLARCTSLACRAVFPDIIAGVSYVDGELDDVPQHTTTPAAAYTPPVGAPVVADEDGVIVDAVLVEDEQDPMDPGPLTKPVERVQQAADDPDPYTEPPAPIPHVTGGFGMHPQTAGRPATQKQLGVIRSMCATLGVGQIKAGDFAHWVCTLEAPDRPDGLLLTAGEASHVISELSGPNAKTLAAGFMEWMT